MRAVFAVLFLVSANLLPRQPRPLAPDVFLVTIDTLRADHVHCYGYSGIQTPAIDALAAEGIRFSQAFTPSPITNTSHTTILTGLLPSSHRVTDFAIPLTPSHSTLAELLKSRGYHTAAFIGAVILDSHSLAPGLDRGFDFYDNFPEHSKSTSHWGRLERRGMDVVQRAEKWLTAHPAGPHFVWLHLYDPHDPYEPPAPYSQTYKNRLYDGEISYADSALGEFLAFIKRRGWYDNSVVVVVGDHGEGLGEHGEDTHGIFLYDSTTHVPLVIRLPGNADRHRTVDTQVSTTSILPTVLDLLAIPRPPALDGTTLKPYFVEHEPEGQIVYGETDYPVRFGWAPLRSVRWQSSKFIEAPRPELFDLRADPAELKNNYVPWAENVKWFRSKLADLRAKLPTTQPSSASVPQSTVEELQALGYLGQADVGSSSDVLEPSLLPDPKDKIQQANLLHTATMAAEDNRFSDARNALEKVLQLDPKSTTATRQLGKLELKSGDYVKAAEHLKSAREARPSDVATALYEGQAREKLRDFTGARDALEASLKYSPSQLAARLLLGQVYLELKDAKAAEDQYEAATLLDPRSVDGHLGLARAEIAGGDFAQATGQLISLSKSQPRNPEVFDLLAQAYKGQGKAPQAQEAEVRARLLRKTSNP